MLGDIEGYCFVNKDADVMSTLGAKAFQGNIVRCLEINEDTKSILALSNCGTALGMFDIKDTRCRFKCGQQNGWITPPNLEPLKRSAYVVSLLNKTPPKDKDLIMKLVIANSLAKGKFCSVVYDRIMNTKENS